VKFSTDTIKTQDEARGIIQRYGIFIGQK